MFRTNLLKVPSPHHPQNTLSEPGNICLHARVSTCLWEGAGSQGEHAAAWSQMVPMYITDLLETAPPHPVGSGTAATPCPGGEGKWRGISMRAHAAAGFWVSQMLSPCQLFPYLGYKSLWSILIGVCVRLPHSKVPGTAVSPCPF